MTKGSNFFGGILDITSSMMCYDMDLWHRYDSLCGLRFLPLEDLQGGEATPCSQRIRFFKLWLRANRVPFTAILIACLSLVLLRVWNLGGWFVVRSAGTRIALFIIIVGFAEQCFKLPRKRLRPNLLVWLLPQLPQLRLNLRHLHPRLLHRLLHLDRNGLIGLICRFLEECRFWD